MPQPATKNNDGYNFLPVRKDQRFPPRYNNQTKPVIGHGVNMIKLIKKVAKTQIINSQYVSIKRVDINKEKPLIKIWTVTRDPKQTPREHIQRIYAADQSYKGPLYLCPAVKVTCDCGNNLFQWEISNAYHGISDVIYSNGDFPIQTNPGLQPGVCKHILKALLFIVANKL